MSFLNPFETDPLKNVRMLDDSPKSLYNTLSARYNVKKVEKGRRGDYIMTTRDGKRTTVKVGHTRNLWGEDRMFIKEIDD